MLKVGEVVTGPAGKPAIEQVKVAAACATATSKPPARADGCLVGSQLDIGLDLIAIRGLQYHHTAVLIAELIPAGRLADLSDGEAGDLFDCQQGVAQINRGAGRY